MQVGNQIAIDITAVLAATAILLALGYAYVNALPQRRTSTASVWFSSHVTSMLRASPSHAILYWILPVFAYFILHPLAGILLLVAGIIGWCIDNEYGHLL